MRGRGLWLLLAALVLAAGFAGRSAGPAAGPESVRAAQAGAEIPDGSASDGGTADGQSVPSDGGRYAALTFDDGPRPGTTDALLDGLRERGVPATFFVIGQEAEAHPDLIVRMRDEGHQIGSHTWSHSRLDGLTAAQTAEEVRRTEALLHGLTGQSGFWLRPPYGVPPPDAEAVISVPMVKWSVDPRDWESRDADAVVRAVLAAVEPGSVVLLHDVYPTSVDAALRLADLLRERGYTLVTAEELLRLTGVTPVPGRIYRSGGDS